MSLVISNQDTVLGTIASVIIPSASLTQVTVLKCTAVNTDVANAHAITIYRVPNLSSPSEAYLMFENIAIPPTGFVSLDMSGQSVNGGSTFQATCDANSVVNFNASFATQT